MSQALYDFVASALRGIATGLLVVGTWATPVLRWSRWFEEKAWRAAGKAPPEWLRRFWARDRPGHRQEGRDGG